MTRWLVRTTLLVLPFLEACRIFAPASRIEFLVESTAFTAPATVGFTIQNALSEAVTLPRCGDRVIPEIERVSGSQWVNAAAAICPANLSMVPIQLNPGELATGTVHIVQLGHYRLRTGIQTATRSEVIVSRSFTVQ